MHIVNKKSRKMFYKIKTNRLVIRCYQPQDAFLLKKSVDESIEHLKTFMPWAHDEPQTIEQKIELIRFFRGNFDLNKDFTMGIFNADETKLLGGTGLHKRVGENALEIGYWVNVFAINNGYATETSAALTKAGFDFLGLDRIYIFHNKKNTASSKIPEKLGYKIISKDAVPKERAEILATQGEHLFWEMTKEDFQKSTIKNIDIKFFDILNNIIK